MSSVIKVHCLHHNRFWLAGSENVSLAGSSQYYCRQQLIPLYFGDSRSLTKTPILCKNAINFLPFLIFFLGSVFCKWDMFIVLCVSFQNAFFCDGVGVVGVAGTRRCTQANERTQQAAYSSNKTLFHRPNQHEDNGHTQPNIHSERGPRRKQVNGTIESFIQQPNQQNLCFLGPLQLHISHNYTTN